MSEEELKELQEYNLEYLEAQASEEMFGGDFTSAVELKQAKKEIERLNNIINEIEEHFVFLKMNSTGGNKEFFEDILDFIKALKELKGSDKK